MNDLTPVFIVLFLIACMAVVAAGYALLDWRIKRIVARDKKDEGLTLEDRIRISYITTGRYLGVPEYWMNLWLQELHKLPGIPIETASLRIMEFTERFLREHDNRE
jgi:hypothetical protein